MDAFRSLRGTKKVQSNFISSEEMLMEEEISKRVAEIENLEGKVKKMKKVGKAYGQTAESFKKSMDAFPTWVEKFVAYLKITLPHVDLANSEEIARSIVASSGGTPAPSSAASSSEAPSSVASSSGLSSSASATPASTPSSMGSPSLSSQRAGSVRGGPPRPQRTRGEPRGGAVRGGAVRGVQRGDSSAAMRSPRRRGRGRVVSGNLTANASSSMPTIRRSPKAPSQDTPPIVCTDGVTARTPRGRAAPRVRGRSISARGRARGGAASAAAAAGLTPPSPGRPARPPRKSGSLADLHTAESDGGGGNGGNGGGWASVSKPSTTARSARSIRLSTSASMSTACVRRSVEQIPSPASHTSGHFRSSSDDGALMNADQDFLKDFIHKPMPKPPSSPSTPAPNYRGLPPASSKPPPPPKPAAPLVRDSSTSHSNLIRVVKEKPLDSAVGMALAVFLAGQRAHFELDCTLHLDVDRTLFFPLSNEITEFHKSVQAAKKIYDRNRAEFMKAAQALAKERSKQVLDVIKLFICEREVVRLRPSYEESLKNLYALIDEQTRQFQLIQASIDMFVATQACIDITAKNLASMGEHVVVLQSLIQWKQLTVENCRQARAEGYQAAHERDSRNKYLSLLKVLTEDGAYLTRALVDTITSSASKSTQEQLLTVIHACYTVMNKTPPAALNEYPRKATVEQLIEDSSFLSLQNFMHTQMDAVMSKLKGYGEPGISVVYRFLDGLAESEKQTQTKVDKVSV